MYIYILLQQYKTVYRQLLYEGMTVCVCVYMWVCIHTHTHTYIFICYISLKETQKRWEKVAQMTNPALQILGCFFMPNSFFFLFFFPPLLIFFPPSTTIIFLLCSVCVSDTTTCFHSTTRNYPEKLTCQPTASPSVLCEHLFTEGHWCKTDHGLVLFGDFQSPLSQLQEMGLLPSTCPQHTLFFWCSTLKNCSVTKLHSWNYWSGVIALDHSLPRWHMWTVVGGTL